MQKYYNNSIMSKFIKNLLYKTYLPICKTVKTGDFLLEGWDYVYETNWIKCTKTGYLGGKYNQKLNFYHISQWSISFPLKQGDIVWDKSLDGTIKIKGILPSVSRSISSCPAQISSDSCVHVILNGYGDLSKVRFQFSVSTDSGYTKNINISESSYIFNPKNYPDKVFTNFSVRILTGGSSVAGEEIDCNFTVKIKIFKENEEPQDIEESNINYASYIRIAPHEFGRLYNKLTQNYISKYGYYDVETHEYLGDFLRVIRDVKGINLMPFYNLYTDEFIINYRISEEGLDPYLTDSFKILKVPIKFNQKYTIALDCPSEVWMCPAFFRKDTPLTTKRQSGTEVSYTQLLNEYGHYIQNYSSMSFKTPVLFEVPNTSLGTIYKSNVDNSDAEYFQQYEKDLCLLIQIPANNKSSIVVLEGDYTNIPQEYVVNRNEVYKLHESEISDFLISNLSLLQFSTKENYVYSDRLIEYLLWNVITSQEEIVQNIELVQDLTPSARYGHTIFGIWDKALRFKVYDFSTQSSGTKNIDLNGFVDKDTEKLLVKQLF